MARQSRPEMLYLSGFLLLLSLSSLLPNMQPYGRLLTAFLGTCLGLSVASLTAPAALPASILTSRPEVANAAFKAVWVMTAVLVALIAGWNLSDLDWRWGRSKPGHWVLALASLGMVLVYYRHFYRPVTPLVTNLPSFWPAALGLSAFFGLTNSLAEEYLFRRLVQGPCIRTLGPAWGLAAQAIMYGCLHLGLASRPNGPAGALAMTVLGWVLGYITYRGKGLGIATTVHAVLDTLIFWWG